MRDENDSQSDWCTTMTKKLIEKLLTDAVQTGGTYAEFVVSEEKVAFICDGGTRKSTRNYRRSKVEIKEDEQDLKTISEKNLLFSGALSRIDITFRSGRTALFTKRTDNGFCVLTARKANETREKTFEYICFSADKSAYTGIAFATEQSSKSRRRIKPCSGMIMNGPNNTGIPTDLQFVISGDFGEEQSLHANSDSMQNEATIEELTAIFEAALKDMMHLRLLDMPLFAVLPNSADEKNLLNTSFIQTARAVCNSYPMFKSRSGGFVSRNRIAYGDDEVTKLFPQEIAKDLLGDKLWIKPCKAGSREERFLLDAGVPHYDRERFLNLMFAEDNLIYTDKILEEQSDKWLREFYIFCSEPITEVSTRQKMIAGFHNTRSIRDSKGRMRFPNELACSTHVKPLSNKSLIIKPDIIAPSGTDDEYSEQLRSFFLKDLGITEYSQKPEIENIAASMMTKKQSVDKLYTDKLLLLAQYDEAHPGEIDFGTYGVFPYQSSIGIRRTLAAELVIGKPYIREGKLLASATGRKPLWAGFKKLLSEPDLETVLAFAQRSGAIGAPSIIRQPAEIHPDFYDILYVPGKQGARDSNYDYTIPGLDDILKKKSLQLNRMVWAALLACNHADVAIAAEYSVNNRSIVNQCDSTLVKILRKRTWIPGKDGKFYMPENIAASEISEDFTFSKDNPILKSLQFGSGIEKRRRMRKELEKFAAHERLRLVPEEEYREFIAWKNRNTRIN